MSSRKPGYVISVILLAAMLSAPPVLAGIIIGFAAYQRGQWPFPSPIGGSQGIDNILNKIDFWRNQFVMVRWSNEDSNGEITTVDPETGEFKTLELDLPGRIGGFTFVAGDRIWFVDRNDAAAAHEFVDGVLQKSRLIKPYYWDADGERFLWKGEPAFIDSSYGRVTVSTFQNDLWTPIGVVAFPQTALERMMGGTPITLSQGDFAVYGSEDEIHLFLNQSGLLFHRKGLDLKSVQSHKDLLRIESVAADKPESALMLANSDSEIDGWSLVRNHPCDGNGFARGFLIDGIPFALIVDETSSANPIGRLYRLEGAAWSETVSQRFPFGSHGFRIVTSDNGQHAYCLATTTTGATHVYAVDTSGFRKTFMSVDFYGATGWSPIVTNAHGERHSYSYEQGRFHRKIAAPWMNPVVVRLAGYSLVPVLTLMLGTASAACTTYLMRWFTSPDYAFGTQTVKLASLRRRGVARLIDLSLIGLTTMSLGCLMTRGFDWQAFVEAMNMNVHHFTIAVAQWIAAILAIWLAAMIFGMLLAQAFWGITPGKWLCCLKTVRTSLRPCGFARSLARETVFFVDCFNFLCWMPGILSIAFTDKRQRLGDLVADTIVVESRSLEPRGTRQI